MIVVYNGETDITDHYERNTFRLTEQLNNRRNTAALNTRTKITEGTAVYVYETVQILIQANSGTDTLTVRETHEYEEKWRPGDELIVDIKGEDEKKFIVESVDHDAGEIVLTSNLHVNVTPEMKVGRLLFAGVCNKNPKTELGHAGTARFDHRNSLVDWSPFFDRKLVNDTYVNMHMREVMGRVLYDFVAEDERLDLDDFEAAWMEGGVGIAMDDETTDWIEGAAAQETGTTGVGTATYTKTISTVDLSSFEHLRLWWKVADGEGAKITSVTLRFGDDASNYFEVTIANVGADFEDCWNYEALRLSDRTTTGSPDLSDVTWLQIRVACTGAIPDGDLLFDHLFATSGGFTMQHVTRGSTKFSDVRVSRRRASRLFEEMTKEQALDWYIDYERDIHVFAMEDIPAPITITDTSLNFGDLTVEADVTSLVNRQVVRGGEAPGESTYVQEKVADGVQTSFTLDYKPKDLKVYVSAWNGSSYDAYVEKTVGIENLDDPDDFDFLFSFQEKVVRNATFPTLDGQDIDTGHPGDKIKMEYLPYLPILVQVTDPTSIAGLKAILGGDGIIDGEPISDERIRSFGDARKRARAGLRGNALVTVDFVTDKDGLHAGQTLPVQSSRFGIEDSFIVQKISMRCKDDNRFEYSVQAGTTLYGLIEFFQMLLRRGEKPGIDTNEVVDILVNIDETVTITDAYIITTKAVPFDAADYEIIRWFDFEGKSGQKTSNGVIGTGLFGTRWYAHFIGDTGEIEFVSGNYLTGRELRLEATTGGNGKEVKARHFVRLPVLPDEQYTLTAWLELIDDLTNVDTGGGVRVVVREYENAEGGTPLATNTIFSGITGKQDFHARSGEFITDPDTAFIEIDLSIHEAAGAVSFGELRLLYSGALEQIVANPARASFSEAS